MEWIISGVIAGILIKWWYVKMPYLAAIVIGAAMGFFAVLSLVIIIVVKKIN